MAERSIHCVVVENDSGDGGPFWGVVSDLDLIAAATVRDLDDQTAGGTAASPIVMVTPTETLERAAQLMTEHSTSHLVVVDVELLKPVGVISTLDIAAALAGFGIVRRGRPAPTTIAPCAPLRGYRKAHAALSTEQHQRAP